jgi:hypothetical protein
LPFYNDLAEDDQMKVIEAIKDTAGWETPECSEPHRRLK